MAAGSYRFVQETSKGVDHMGAQNLKIVVTDPLVGRMPEISRERYPEEDKRIEWVMAEKGDEEELLGLVSGASILVGARYTISAEVLKKADKAYFHQQCSQGYDNIDLDAAKALGITVSHSGTAGTVPVATPTMPATSCA